MSSSIDLILKPACSGCGSTAELYGSNCKHLTLCVSCGKSMAEKRTKCFDCGATVTGLIREVKPVKEEPISALRSSVPAKGAVSAPPESGSTSAAGPVTEDEIRAVLTQRTPVTTQDLVAKFKSRLKSKEDKNAFAAILRRISKIQKTTNGRNFVVVRER